MEELYRLKCRACRTGDPSLSDTEIIVLHRQIPNWDVKKVEGVKRLERVFMFEEFAHARLFVDKASAIAEQENHHPLITIEHRKVTLSLWTHKVNGLHLNDFIMAAKMDRLRQLFPDR
jgi:4a-hydroxytetrahydrobiopterin dehydratase